MIASQREKNRVFLANWVFTLVYGITLQEWLRLLWKHRFAIDPLYWPRATFMSGISVINSIVRRRENRTYSLKVVDVNIKPPVFILGHWRSGTTHLHNLLAVDRQTAYPTAYQVLNPHTFLSTEKYSRLVFVSPKTRIIDNMSFGSEVPLEDEFAICGTLRSPYLGWVFPRAADHYERYLTFRGIPEEEIAEWKTALLLFYKKLTWKYDRPLLLKSPPHTCRIRLLLDMFPDARFVHIYRNPYTVFQSTKQQYCRTLRTMTLQSVDFQHLDAQIIRRYKSMYDVFFEERALIPEGRLHEVRFEELEKDPVGQVRKIYERLNLPGFDTIQSSLQRYVDSLADYRKNQYPELPSSLRREIAQAWQQSFEQWGYTP